LQSLNDMAHVLVQRILGARLITGLSIGNRSFSVVGRRGVNNGAHRQRAREGMTELGLCSADENDAREMTATGEKIDG
jgi:hypothetical protein